MNNHDWDPLLYQQNAGYVGKLGSPLIEMLDKDTRRVLDLGCGDGELSMRIASAGFEVTGIDASPSMVAAAKARGLDARVMDGQQISLPETFDAVISNAALHWMKSADDVIAGVRSVLRPGGLFVAECGGYGNVQCVIQSITHALSRLGRESAFSNPWYFPSDVEYRARLEAQGFEVLSIALFDRPTPLPEGLRGWLQVFAKDTLQHLAPKQSTAFLDYCEEFARAQLWTHDDGWLADYVRLRFKAFLR